MKMIIANNIKMPVEHDESDVLGRALFLMKKRGIIAENPIIYKKSLDARRKNDIHFVYSVVAEAQKLSLSALDSDIREFELPMCVNFDEIKASAKIKNKVLVVGSGPCGLFAAYILSKCGANPILIERGSDADTRQEKVTKFWNGGELDSETNIQFGEGGAGTFSDGKLNTRIGDVRQRFVLETFVENGAPNDILYQAKPHVGTDYLRECVKNIRKKIVDNGGEVMFNTRLTDIKIKNGKVCGAELNFSHEIDCNSIVLAIGHSSRDTYEMLAKHGVVMEQKPFAAGVRIEHKREFINESQYGKGAHNSLLPTAEYRLAYNGEERSCYSFCMCPGGIVVNASSENGGLVVNGMSYHNRMEENSNSALVVTVRPEDFDGNSALAGVEFQRKYERLAYETAKGKAPVQLARDFMKNKTSSAFDGVIPSFTGETSFADLRECLPEFISSTLKDGLFEFDRKIKGFSSCGAVLTGVEMRTSAPLRIKRDENYQSVNVEGLFPAGEGAGYAGGIMSAAVDGMKIAEKLLKAF